MKPDRNDLLHIETCALIVLVLSAFLPLWLSAILAFIIGIVKELWDKEHGGVASWRDVGWDAVGTIIGTIIETVKHFMTC